jgi:hypothetical protein
MDSLNFNTSNFFGKMAMMNRHEIQPTSVPDGGFDPHKMFVKKSGDVEPLGFQPKNVPQYSDEEIRELEEYCKSRGIIGVNFGSMSPRSVLNMLREKNGFQTEKKRSILHD